MRRYSLCGYSVHGYLLHGWSVPWHSVCEYSVHGYFTHGSLVQGYPMPRCSPCEYSVHGWSMTGYFMRHTVVWKAWTWSGPKSRGANQPACPSLARGMLEGPDRSPLRAPLQAAGCRGSAPGQSVSQAGLGPGGARAAAMNLDRLGAVSVFW